MGGILHRSLHNIRTPTSHKNFPTGRRLRHYCSLFTSWFMKPFSQFLLPTSCIFSIEIPECDGISGLNTKWCFLCLNDRNVCHCLFFPSTVPNVSFVFSLGLCKNLEITFSVLDHQFPVFLSRLKTAAEWHFIWHQDQKIFLLQTLQIFSWQVRRNISRFDLKRVAGQIVLWADCWVVIEWDERMSRLSSHWSQLSIVSPLSTRTKIFAHRQPATSTTSQETHSSQSLVPKILFSPLLRMLVSCEECW